MSHAELTDQHVLDIAEALKKISTDGLAEIADYFSKQAQALDTERVNAQKNNEEPRTQTLEDQKITTTLLLANEFIRARLNEEAGRDADFDIDRFLPSNQPALTAA